MTDINFRLNLTASNIPLLHNLHGRSVMVRGAEDSNPTQTNSYGGGSYDRDLGIPSIVYLHNVLPVNTGLSSVRQLPLVQPAGQDYTARAVYEVRDCEERRYLYLPTENSNYVLDLKSKVWKEIQGISVEGYVTTATIHKTTYVCKPYTIIEKFTDDMGALIPAQLEGIDPSAILGITHANNYLILYTADTIHWSSAIESDKFTPTLDTLAGSIIPLHIRGAIIRCYPIRSGFLIFTTNNVVRAEYSGTSDFPFRFSEVYNSGGLRDPYHLSQPNNLDKLVYYSSRGLVELTKDDGNCTIIFPEISDFLAGDVYEDYIGNTGKVNYSDVAEPWSSETEMLSQSTTGHNELVLCKVESPMEVAISYVGTRYLVISYGMPNVTISNLYQWALVFDLEINRWGKLRFKHNHVFEINNTDWIDKVQLQSTKHEFGLMQFDGELFVLDFDTYAKDTDSVLLFGKLQHNRSKRTCIHSIELENSMPQDTTLGVLTSLDGKNYQPCIYPTKVIDTRDLAKWYCRTTGVNHILKITGTFNLVSLTGTMVVTGDR